MWGLRELEGGLSFGGDGRQHAVVGRPRSPPPDPQQTPNLCRLWPPQWLPPEVPALFIASPQFPAGRGKSISVFADRQL